MQQLDDAFFVNGTVQASQALIALSDRVSRVRPFVEGLDRGRGPCAGQAAT